MHSKAFQFLSILTLVTILFSACRKDPDIIDPKPNPQPTNQSNLFQFTVDNINSLPGNNTDQWNAWVSIVDQNNDTVVKNKVLTFHQQKNFATNQLELPAGQYRLVRFKITDNKTITHFAAPMAGSSKAQLVSKPLSIPFTLPQPTVTNIAVNVAAVASSDSPESFGYPAGYFDARDESKPDETTFIKIKLQAFCQIGDIMYDKISAPVQVYITNANGQQTTKNIQLVPGENEVLLPNNASRFHFVMHKWGITSELFLDISQVREGSLYGIGGNAKAKKLKSEVIYRSINGHFVAERKIDYQYDRDGRLGRIDYYGKKADGKPYINMYELFKYSNDNVDVIEKYNDKNELSSEMTFTYNASGKVKTISEANNVSWLNAAVTYFQTPGKDNTHIRYTYSHNTNTLDYNMSYVAGNLSESASSTSFGNSELGHYQYDSNINPYAHLQRPDLYLSGQSKNNVVSQQITYGGTTPQATPFKFEYTYDNEGYPKEVITYYKVPATNAPAYTLKTVYTYL